jgi:hypothetical protein
MCGIVLTFIKDNIEYQTVYKLYKRVPDSLVGIVTRLRSGPSGVRTPNSSKRYFYSPKAQTGSRVYPAFCSRGSEAGARCWPLNLHPHPDVKIKWSYASAPSICLRGVIRDNFFFLFFFFFFPCSGSNRFVIAFCTVVALSGIQTACRGAPGHGCLYSVRKPLQIHYRVTSISH